MRVAQLHALVLKFALIPRLRSVLPAVLLMAGGNRAGVTLLYFVTPAYDRVELLVVVKLVWYLYSVLPSPSYFGSHPSATISNYSF